MTPFPVLRQLQEAFHPFLGYFLRVSLESSLFTSTQVNFKGLLSLCRCRLLEIRDELDDLEIPQVDTSSRLLDELRHPESFTIEMSLVQVWENIPR